MLAPDTHLGIYRLIERIGAGGMGEVWKAEDTRLGRTVAIKILPQSVSSDSEAIARLKREARTAAQLNHPNIATIHAIEESDGQLFIVMEYVDGEPLSKVFQRGVAEADLCRIGRSVADALAEAHAKGIVHRDIKPDNIIVSGPRVKVLDFGIAKQVGGAVASNAPTAPFLTQEGMVLGTIHYMSPEQALGKALDPRSDIFSLGVVLYEGATHTLPFHGETVTDTMTRLIRDEPPEPRHVNAMISTGLNAIIQKCLKKNRDERYASAGDLGHALDEQLGRASTAPYTKTAVLPPAPPTVKEPVAQRRWWPWLAAAVLAIAIATMLWVGQRKHPVAVLHETTTAAPKPAEATMTVPAPKIEETRTSTTSVTPPTATAPEPATASASTVTTAPAPSSEDQYKQAMQQLRDGDVKGAQESLHNLIKSDPHYALAHLRLGEIALFRRDFEHAQNQFNTALNDADKLTPHDQALSRLGLAVAQRDRNQATEIAHAILGRWPNDPEVLRIHREFPGMIIAAPQRPFNKRRGRF